MLQRIKVGKFTLKRWWIFFICTQVLLISLMLASLFVDSWVYSDAEEFFNIIDQSNETSYLVKLPSFKGSLSECLEGCEDIYKYSKLKIAWCTSEQLNQTGSSSKLCEMFENLSEAGKILTIFEAISLVQVLVWGFTMMMFVRKVKYFGMSYCSSICGCFSHYIGFLAWVGITGAAAVNCQEMHDKVPLCFSVGPAIQIVIFAFYPILVVVYFIVSCKGYARRTDSQRVNPALGRNPANSKIVFSAKILNPDAVFNALNIQNDQQALQHDIIPYAHGASANHNHLDDADEKTALQVDDLRTPSPFKKIEEKNIEHSEIILNLPPPVNNLAQVRDEISGRFEKDDEEKGN